LFGWGAVLILLLVSAGSGYGLWRWSRGDSRFRQGAMRRVRGLSPPEREAEQDAGR
jgi:hypothetical protein